MPCAAVGVFPATVQCSVRWDAGSPLTPSRCKMRSATSRKPSKRQPLTCRFHRVFQGMMQRSWKACALAVLPVPSPATLHRSSQHKPEKCSKLSAARGQRPEGRVASSSHEMTGSVRIGPHKSPPIPPTAESRRHGFEYTRAVGRPHSAIRRDGGCDAGCDSPADAPPPSAASARGHRHVCTCRKCTSLPQPRSILQSRHGDCERGAG